MGLGVEVAPPGPAGAVRQDPMGRKQALGEQRVPAGQISAKALGHG